MAVELIQPSEHRPTKSTIACAAVAALAITGPLLVATGLSFAASVMVLVVTSPLLIVFSPIILPACAVIAAAAAGFTASAGMAFVGLGVLSWMVRYVRGRGRRVRAQVVVAETVTESGQRVKEQMRDWDGGVVQVYPPDSSKVKVQG